MSRRIADLLIKIGADSYEFQQKAQQVNKSLDSVSKKLTSVGKELSLKLTAPLVALGAVSIHLYDVQAKAEAKVKQAIKSTAGAAKLSFDQLKAYASELQGKTVFGDETILNNSTAQLLTFTNIAGENFKRTQKAAMDIATVLDGDLKSASIQLGKALNDPVKNLSALSRSGIQFSEDQKGVITSLAETGRLAEAQVVILNELERQYGGQAEAAASAGMGALQQLKNTWGDFMEQIGAAIMPMMKKLAGSLKGVVEWLMNLSPTTKQVIVVVAGLAAAVGPLLLTIGGIIKLLPMLKAGLLALSSPLTALIGLAAMLTYAFYSAFNSYKKLQSVNGDLATEWVAEGRYKPGDEGQIQGYIDGYQKQLKAHEAFYEKLGGFKSMNADYRDRKAELEGYIDINQRVLAELAKKKKADDTAAEASRKMIEEARVQAEEWQKLAQNIEDTNSKKEKTSKTTAERVPMVAVNPPAVAKIGSVSVATIDPIIVAVKSRIEQLRSMRAGVTQELADWAGGMSDGVVAMASSASETILRLTETMTQKGVVFANALGSVTERVTSMIKSFNDGLQQFLADSIVTAFDAIGQIIAGDMGLDGLLNAILLQMASFLKQIGTQLIQFGLMIVGFRAALKAVLANPWAAIGIGAAMVTAAAIMTALINKNAEKNVPKLARGGLAYGPTYAMVGDNPGAHVDPEVIAPLSKLKGMMIAGGGGAQRVAITLTGQLTAKGRDLVYILGKENFKIDLLGG